MPVALGRRHASRPDDLGQRARARGGLRRQNNRLRRRGNRGKRRELGRRRDGRPAVAVTDCKWLRPGGVLQRTALRARYDLPVFRLEDGGLAPGLRQPLRPGRARRVGELADHLVPSVGHLHAQRVRLPDGRRICMCVRPRPEGDGSVFRIRVHVHRRSMAVRRVLTGHVDLRVRRSASGALTDRDREPGRAHPRAHATTASR
jgi:hypothetical protein